MSERCVTDDQIPKAACRLPLSICMFCIYIKKMYLKIAC